MTIILICIAIIIIFVLWFTVGLSWSYNDLQKKEEEIQRHKKMQKKTVDEIKNLKSEKDRIQDKAMKLVKENGGLINLIEKYQDRYWPYKLTIAETYKDAIIDLYKKWKSNKQIAEEIWCWESTIRRAVVKWWLKR